jgi:hypothetical protein
MLNAAILSLLLAWHVDVSATFLPEVWDINESRESLAGLAAGIDRRVWRGVAVRGEILALRVFQRPEHAWLGGFTLGTRMRWETRRTRPFVDVGVGLSNSTVPVPSRGTRFNYLALVGAGVELPAGPALISVTGRWLHASNNGRAGRHLNPDIQALGALVGVGWGY